MIASTTLLAMAGIAAVAYARKRRARRRADPLPAGAAAPAADEGSSPVRDVEEALRITGGSIEVADMLIADLLGSLPDQLTQAEKALEQGDWERLRALIHRIKGATAVCAVPPLHRAVCELQRAAREADTGLTRSWMKRVEVERQRLAAALDVHPGG
jgi:two-component system sensor histidine kinase BarA